MSKFHDAINGPPCIVLWDFWYPNTFCDSCGIFYTLLFVGNSPFPCQVLMDEMVKYSFDKSEYYVAENVL